MTARRLRETIARGMRLARVGSQQDIARLAGVTPGAVSKVLGSGRRVPAAVKVLAALGLIDDLGVAQWSEDDCGGLGGP